MDDHLTGILSNIGVISFVALSAYLLLLTGEISFGQQAFFAIGAYTAGIVTAMWQLPFWLGLGAGAAAGGAAALFVGLPTLRLHGLQFAIATLAFAEAVRILFELFRYQVVRDGEQVGPNGIEGFRVKLMAACLAGAIAGLGGGLYAHLTTYVEPAIFDVMLGVHSLAYGLIGGLGTAFGPLLGVVIDIGLLESTRWFAGYRMIVFGGLVAVLLIVRPRGLLDERLVHRIRRLVSRRPPPAPTNAAVLGEEPS